MLDPIQELKEDHRKVRDGILDLIDSLSRTDAQKALEVLIILDKLGGPHFRFEEEAFYPALEKFFGKDYYEQMIKAHDRVIGAAKNIAEVLGKGSVTKEEAEKLVTIVRNEVLPHPIECEGLVLLAEKLSSDEINKIAIIFEKVREDDIPLLEWADTIRNNKQ